MRKKQEVICAGCGQYESECRCDAPPSRNRIEEVKKMASMVWAFGLNQRMIGEGRTERFSPEDFEEQRLINKNPYLDFASQICQLFPQPLDDKELIKGIAEIALDFYGVGYKRGIRYSKPWEANENEVGEATTTAKQILALLQPKIEEAREKIRKQAIKSGE